MKVANFFRRLRQEESGLTLIELMVVIVIIGVLSSVSIPKYTNVIDRAKINADIATGSAIKSAIDRYYIDNGSYPGGVGSSASTVVSNLVSNGYLNSSGKYGQNSGGSSADNPANFDTIFQVTERGDVEVYRVDVNFSNPELYWASNS